MYLTQTDIAKLYIEHNNNLSGLKALMEIIKEDAHSQEKADMFEGDEYYNKKHKILDHDFRQYYLEKEIMINPNKSNNKICHPYHTLHVDQKRDYIAGKRMTIASENELFQKDINELLGKRFHDMMPQIITDCSNRGRDYLHPFINANSQFDFLQIKALEVIPIYDTQFQRDLIGIIRYFQVEVQETIDSPVEYKYKVEVWDHEKTMYFMEYKDGELRLDTDYTENPKYHWYLTNDVLKSRIGQSWGRVPIIEFKNNDTAVSDLTMTKALIDDYDFQVSNFSNKLIDFARLVWILKGYDGTDLKDFVSNLESFGAIKVKKDGAVDNKTAELPYEAHDSHLDRLEDNIFIFGRAVNMKKANDFSNAPSQVALKFMYALLDLKANTAIRKLDLSLENFFWFGTQYINIIKRKTYDVKDINSSFNKSVIMNEKEIIEMLNNSREDVSDKTRREKHPLIDDIELEEKRLVEQNGDDEEME